MIFYLYNMRRRILKLILVIAMIILAGFAAVALKDFMDRRNPYYAIPQIYVTADSEPVAVMVAGYEWKFALGGSINRDVTPATSMQLRPTNMSGGEKLEIDFSVEPKSAVIMRTISYTYEFEEIGEKDLTIPYESGGYIYKVSAEFASGSATWYFYIIV